MSTLDRSIKLTFYINFANQLTTTVRAIWSNESVLIADRLDRIKWINEVSHCVLNRAHDHHDSQLWTEKDLLETIRVIVAQNPTINGHVGSAILSAYEQTMRQAQASA